MASLKVKVPFPSSVFDTRGLVKLVILYGEDMSLSSWGISFDEKLSVSGIVELVEDMITDAKREMRPKTLGMPSPLLYFSKKNLHLSP